MTKRVRSSFDRLAAGNKNAWRPVAQTVVSPPVFSPSGSLPAPSARVSVDMNTAVQAATTAAAARATLIKG